MAGRTVSIELTDEQADLLDEIAAGQGVTPEALLPEAIAHGLAMIVAGVDDSDLIEPWDRPGPHQAEPERRPMPPPTRSAPTGDDFDDLPF